MTQQAKDIVSILEQAKDLMVINQKNVCSIYK